MDAKLDKAKADIAKGVIGNKMDGELVYKTLPAEGMSKAELTTILQRYSSKDRACWDTGKVRQVLTSHVLHLLPHRLNCLQLSGSIYHGGDELCEIMSEAFSHFSLSNPLHPEVFPSVRKVEERLFKAHPWPARRPGMSARPPFIFPFRWTLRSSP